MKIIYLIFNVSLQELFTDRISKMKFHSFQIIENVLSENTFSDPRMNTSVWPGQSTVFVIQSNDDNKTELLIEEIKKHNSVRLNDDELIMAYVWKTEMSITE
jgi:hypothetical protein